MPVFVDAAEESREAQLAEARMKLTAIENDKNRQFMLEKLRIELQIKQAQKRAVGRLEVTQRILLALIKLPTLPLVLFLVGGCVARKSEVPQFLIDYLSL